MDGREVAGVERPVNYHTLQLTDQCSICGEVCLIGEVVLLDGGRVVCEKCVMEAEE